MPMSIKRDDSGFIEIDRMRITKVTKIPNYAGFSFVYKGKKYFFKYTRSLDYIYNEMIAYELAQDFGIEAVSYDIASFNGHVGYISEDFYKTGMTYLEDLLKGFYGDDRNKCNLSDVEFMMQERFGEEMAKKLSNQLIDLLMFDLIIGNTDRHDRNIIIDVNNEKLAPAFDNELMLNGAAYGERYCFSLFPRESNVLDSFCRFMDDDAIRRFVDKIEVVNSDNTLRVIARVEKKIGAPLNEYIKAKLIKNFDFQYFVLTKAVKERKEYLSLNLVKEVDKDGNS